VTGDEKAELILRGLSGQHLHDFLPGNDHKAAISHVASGHGGWGGGGSPYWGQVTRKGVGYYPNLTDARNEKNAVMFVSWREVIEVVAKGCSGGRREAYEAAYDAWNHHHDRYPYWEPGNYGRTRKRTEEEAEAEFEDYCRVTDAIRKTTRDIVEAGCSREPIQAALW
jgi:hypothetical protein